MQSQVFRSGGREENHQLILHTVLVHETLKQLHQEHGHQGVQQTTEQIQQHCYWAGMF